MNMNLEQARRLRKKFYDGTSTPDEERRLRELVLSPDCPPGWEAERFLLCAADALPDTLPVPEGLERRIAGKLSAAPRHRLSLWKKIVFPTGVAAAAVGIAFLLTGRHPAPTVYADTYKTPREAANGTYETLLFISEQFNLGTSEEALGGPCD